MRGHEHPMFTHLYRLIASAGEHTNVGTARTQVLAEATGKLLIVGLGPGHDLDHIPEAVTAIVAVEPSASMRESAAPRLQRVRETGTPLQLIDALGEDLPLPDNSVDSVLLAFVMCSVGDVAAVLAEVRRVAKPGATISVLEHVRAPERTWMRRAQRVVAPIWPRLTGGCHADRPTRTHLEAAGFDTRSLVVTKLVNVPPIAPTLMGSLRL